MKHNGTVNHLQEVITPSSIRCKVGSLFNSHLHCSLEPKDFGERKNPESSHYMEISVCYYSIDTTETITRLKRILQAVKKMSNVMQKISEMKNNLLKWKFYSVEAFFSMPSRLTLIVFGWLFVIIKSYVKVNFKEIIIIMIIIIIIIII